MVFLKKLAAVMFYASIPLLLPFFYSIYADDGAAFSIGITVFVLAFAGIPGVLKNIADTISGLVRHFFHPETPWNYANIFNVESMRKQVDVLTLGEILALTSIAWIVIPAISSIPYLYYGLTPIDAFFESVSGWTTTGLSVIASVSNLPHSIILFRSITQWLGGLGIVVLMLTVIRSSESSKFLKIEGRSSSEIGFGSTVSSIWKIYLTLTVVGIILLFVADIDFFNSVNLTFAGISTGGFFSFDSFDFSLIQKFVLALITISGATSFLFYRNLGRGNIKKAFFDEEFIFYLSIILLSFVLIFSISHEDTYDSFFGVVSAITSSGFDLAKIIPFHDFSKYILVILMIMGAMVGSTGGGLKLRRILILVKSLILHIRAAFLPSGTVQVVKLNGSPVENSAILESSIFVFSYLLLFLVATGVFIAINYTIIDSMFIVASAIGNVGLSTIQVSALGFGTKLFLIILMYLGRIEIFPSLALIKFIRELVRK